MNIILYINGIRRKFSFCAGWFSGNNFTLFSLDLFEKNDSWITLLHIQIVKFLFDITIDEYPDSMRDFD